MNRSTLPRLVAASAAVFASACVSVDATDRDAQKLQASFALEKDVPYLQVLGTAQDGGLPQMGCQLDCCRAAYAEPSLRRTVTSLLLVDPATDRRWLFDASPQLPLQLEALLYHERAPELPAGRPPLFDGVFLTHAHMGHYTGLMHFGREAYGSDPVSTFGTERMLDYLRGNGPWSLLFEAGHLVAQAIRPDVPTDLGGGFSVTPLEVPHRDEFSDTVGFVIRTPESSILYLPDIDKWSVWDRSLVEVIGGVDYAFIDGTFFNGDELPGRNMSEVPHPFIVETLSALAGQPAALMDKVYFTHLNHSNPAARETSEARATIEDAGCHVLEEGQLIPLGASAPTQ